MRELRAMGHLPPPGARVGEIVRASIADFEAQSVQLHQTPALGSLVRVRGGERLHIYGVLAEAWTDGVDPSARPVARGAEGSEDEAIYRDHPDLAHVLRSCFRCIVVGFRDGHEIRRHLPASPPPMHYSVVSCEPVDAEEFTRLPDYFRVIIDSRTAAADEVLAAHIRLMAVARAGLADDERYAYSVRAGRAVAALLRADHQRLLTVLERIRVPVDVR
ncbi:MAG: hypothetical protein GEU73_12790 [Chloroflexi bacterium]|nr:hypothetical protein [Chloroflexota bacterium]